MTTPGPFGGAGNPFEGLFGELAKLFANQGSVNFEVARQLARWLASEGQPEPNVDPLQRVRFEELVRVADLQVGTFTGLSTSVAGRALSVRPVGRSEWAGATLDAYHPLFEALATAMAAPPPGGDDAVASDPSTELLGGVTAVVGPLLLGIQAGTMVGHLAQRALGQYDLPAPRPPGDELLVVPRNVEEFATDWSLAVDDVRLWVCLGEIAHHAVLARPHVRARLDALLREYAGGFQPDPHALEDKLGEVDPTDPASFSAVLGDPAELLGALQTDAQRAVLTRLRAVLAVIEGYVDHVVDAVSANLLGSTSALVEARRRRRVERGQGEQFAERLLGLDLAPDQYERGSAFVKGVIERAGDEGLARLWHSERELPTPPEVDAPGLWLERIDLPE